jgi:hypothetical protein
VASGGTINFHIESLGGAMVSFDTIAQGAVDVQVCGSEMSTKATTIVNAIGDKFPIWYKSRR